MYVSCLPGFYTVVTFVIQFTNGSLFTHLVLLTLLVPRMTVYRHIRFEFSQATVGVLLSLAISKSRSLTRIGGKLIRRSASISSELFWPTALLRCYTERRSWITSYSIELALLVLFVLSVVNAGDMSSSEWDSCVSRLWFLYGVVVEWHSTCSLRTVCVYCLVQ